MSYQTDINNLVRFAGKTLDAELAGLKANVKPEHVEHILAVKTMLAKAAARAVEGEDVKETLGIAKFALMAAADITALRAAKAARSAAEKIGAKALEILGGIAAAACQASIEGIVKRMGG